MSVSPWDVFKKLKNLDITKRGRPDCIPSRVIKEFTYELCFPHGDIYNCLLRDGILPGMWKSAYITRVPKTNPPDLDNIRQIAMTCLFSKVFEDVVNWMLDDITDSLDSHQFGSLKGLSTTYYLVKLLDNLCKGIDKPWHSSILVTTDFSKALDQVSHQIVVEKFSSLGVRPAIRLDM